MRTSMQSTMQSIIGHYSLRRWLLLLAVVVLISTIGLGGTSWLKRQAMGDLDQGLPPLNPLMTVPQPGVNADLTQYSAFQLDQSLTLIREAGFYWVRQTFAWADIEPAQGRYDWETWDGIVDSVEAHDLHLIAVLDTSPSWARTDGQPSEHTPPRDIRDYGQFAHAFAARYGSQIDFYQVWDEPNLSYHWGDRAVDAWAYARLLREAAIQIRQGDPDARILTAGLAPTMESGPLNVSAIDYLGGVYAAGGAAYFDIVAAKCYGFQYPAMDPHVSRSRLNFPRVELLRHVMEQHGDRGKPVWAVEFGWNALPEAWTGPKSPWEAVTVEEQATYTLDALRRAEEQWPWMGALVLSTWQPAAPVGDPVWGFSLVGPGGEPKPLLEQLKRAILLAKPLAYPGRYSPQHPSGLYEGAWRLTSKGADIGADGDHLAVNFRGTRFDMALRKGQYWAVLYVTVDGRAPDALPRAADGRGYVVMYDLQPAAKEVTLARHLAYGDHVVVIEAQGGWDQWAVAGWSVYREADTRVYNVLQVLFALTLAMSAPLLAYVALRLPQPGWWAISLTLLDRIPTQVAQVTTLLGAAAFYWAPGTALSLPGLGMLLLSLLGAPATGLPLIALSAPFYGQPKAILGRHFSMAEIAVLATLGAWSARQILACLTGRHQTLENEGETRRTRKLTARWAMRQLAPLDWGMAALVVVAAASLFVAEERTVALREFRLVVLEPVVFYTLMRATLRGQEEPWRVVDAWLLGGLLISIWGVYQLASGQGIIRTDGTWRVRGPYGSPNNLALMLGRQLPLLATVAAFGQKTRRRLGYVLMLGPVLAAFCLTYSRGGWLLGLPLPLLFVSLVRGGWTLLGTLAALAAGGVAVLSVLGTQRLANLLNPRQGTLFFRLKLWQASLSMIRDHPLLGVGPDNFLYQYRSRYILPSAWQEPNLSHPHNVLLEFWTRLGVLGVIVLVWLETAFFRSAWRVYRRLSGSDLQLLALGAMGGMVDVLAHGMVDNGFFVPDLAYAFCLLTGVVAHLAEGGWTKLTAQEDMLE